MSWKRNTYRFGLVLVLLLANFTATAAAQSTSPNYRVDEYSFNTGGELNACSNGYCSRQSAGETAAGNTKSSSYQAQAGFNTSDVPVLEVAVNGSVDLGVLTPTSTGSGTANIQVRTYLSSGYDLIIAGSPPKMGSESLDVMNATSVITLRPMWALILCRSRTLALALAYRRRIITCLIPTNMPTVQ
jgi:hypothetical protein